MSNIQVGNTNQHVAKSFGNERNAPHFPVKGTNNWKLLNHGPDRFSPRHSHATCVFKCPNNDSNLCIWLTGGYSESHRTFDLDVENENSDVWWSEDGASWNQVTDLKGEFLQGVGNWDAKVGGYVAPWYSRYGHSLNALDADGDGIADAMILAGGYNPMPSNDIWITTDGITWYFDGYAPWPKRAYHGATVFQGKLWIIGGTPLANDVWMGRLIKDVVSTKAGYTMTWNAKVLPHEAPWAPRAGLCAVSQLRRNIPADASIANETEPTHTEFMYILGGFAGFQEGHPLHSDGARSRNDVWVTSDGVSWTSVLPPSGKVSMPWSSRVFHSCTTWHSIADRSRWVTSDSMMHLDNKNWDGNNTHPRIFITGGGYMGRKGNNEVRSLETYMDTWWSYDGSEWMKVNYEEGSKHKNNLYSTNEWTETTLEGKKVYLGKWGHTLESFHVSEDLDMDGEIANTNVSLNICTDSEPVSQVCKKMSATENRIPALFVIGGKLESGPMVNDVFVSKSGVHCELDGVTCGENGDCGPGTMGCICHSSNFSGDYCLQKTIAIEASTSSRQNYNAFPLVLLLWFARSLFGA